MAKKLLVIDGNSILNRAFYGIKLLTNKTGLFTNAIYGMITIISKHVQSLSPDYCVVAFDSCFKLKISRCYDDPLAKGMIKIEVSAEV